MNKLKEALKWLKEKWWLFFSSFAILVAAMFFSRKNSALKIVNINRELDDNIKHLEKEALEKENATRKQILQQAGIKVAELDVQKEKTEMEMLQKNKKRIKELSSKSNKELAEMLKKANEI